MTTPGSSEPPGGRSGGEGPGSPSPVARLLEEALWDSRLLVLMAVVFGVLLVSAALYLGNRKPSESKEPEGP